MLDSRGYLVKVLQLVEVALRFKHKSSFKRAVMREFKLSRANPTLNNMIGSAWSRAEKRRPARDGIGKHLAE